ncbi:MAG: formate dehydrogenase accessory protein FdhE [Gemmatimonadales bacterium]
MQRTGSDLRAQLEALIDERAARTPEWRAFYEMLRVAARALEGDPRAVLLAAQPSPSRPERHTALWCAALVVDSVELARLVSRLAEAAIPYTSADTGAPTLAGLHLADAEAVALLEAVLSHDRDRVAAVAGRAGVDAAALGTVAAFAIPVLLCAAARDVGALVPANWAEGYCPICGEWPLLAELRGLDRSRHLRCGRCAGDWVIAWLACPYCGERDHERLGALVPENGRETRRAETCATCRGYLKTVTTLQALHPVELRLRDLETVELDVAAVDADYRRPGAAALAGTIRVVGA